MDNPRPRSPASRVTTPPSLRNPLPLTHQALGTAGGQRAVSVPDRGFHHMAPGLASFSVLTSRHPRKQVPVPRAHATWSISTTWSLVLGAGARPGCKPPAGCPGPASDWPSPVFTQRPPRLPGAPGGEHRACSGNALCAQWVSLWERHQNSRRKDKKWKQPGGWSSPGSGQLRPGAVEALSQCPGCLGPLGVQGRACRQSQH